MAYMTAPVAQRRGDAPALIDEHGQCTWRELDRRVNRLVRALRASGLRQGDRIALFAGNSRSVFELMAAANHAGIGYVPARRRSCGRCSASCPGWAGGSSGTSPRASVTCR